MTRSQRSMNNERDVVVSDHETETNVIESESDHEVVVNEHEVDEESEVEEDSDQESGQESDEEEEEDGENVHSIVRNRIVSYLPASDLVYECWNISKIYLCWILVHMISVNMYCHFCAHMSLYGLFMSPFMTVAPHCVALRWLTTNSINSISNMWLTVGTWLITKLPVVNRK